MKDKDTYTYCPKNFGELLKYELLSRLWIQFVPFDFLQDMIVNHYYRHVKRKLKRYNKTIEMIKDYKK